MPSFLRQALRCLITTAGNTFLRSSGLPFFTVAMTMSPTPAQTQAYTAYRVHCQYSSSTAAVHCAACSNTLTLVLQHTALAAIADT
jgi:hypothetical protein